MTEEETPTPAPPTLTCSACGQALDATDKFCRECGLPTLHRAEAHRRATELPPPNVAELRQALDGDPAPRPVPAPGPGLPLVPAGPQEPTTGSLLKVTSPTTATRLAGSTALMLVIILALAAAGVLMFVLALRP